MCHRDISRLRDFETCCPARIGGVSASLFLRVPRTVVALASRVKSTSHDSKSRFDIMLETRDTYEKILWTLDRPIVQLETFEVREPSISARVTRSLNAVPAPPARTRPDTDLSLTFALSQSPRCEPARHTRA